ncbi:MAG TPA: hypothetical protein VD996_13670 [Chitinophagaceae bacterium]|nr:hypothetical protein [Chitinophagaceae bacterium]
MDREQTSGNFQDSPHKEGNMGNTPPQGQPREGNNSQSMDNILQDSPEQLAGRKKQQDKDEDKE